MSRSLMHSEPEKICGAGAGSTSNIAYNTALNIEHFKNPAFKSLLREIFHHLALNYVDYPNGNEVAKVWEVVQAVRGLRDFGALNRQSDILGVAAGHEHTVFYLTNYVARVFATDLYFGNEDWNEAKTAMLVSPENFSVPNMVWDPRRLVVQHMDALNLRYEDSSFNGIFSCGSLEHFGTLQNVARAVSEMARVLKPGGILTLSTEYRISGPDTFGYPGTLIFTPEMLLHHVILPSGLTLVDNFEASVSTETVLSAYPISEAIEKGTRSRSIALQNMGFMWTSASLCLRKD